MSTDIKVLNTEVEYEDRMSTHQPSPACPAALASAKLQLHYLAEGAANIIYSVSVLSPPSLQGHSHCCVLRLRKDLSFTKPAGETMSDFERCIAPLFAGHETLLMEQTLYRLTPEMVSTANEELREMDGVGQPALAGENVPFRHHHRRRVYLPSYEKEQYGILMQNLRGPSIDWLVEFKPKWLVQSPSAPRDARNCRTCALNAMRRKAGTHPGRGDSGFCPLDLLVGGDEEDVLERALRNIWPIEGGIKQFVAVFRERVQPALKHLMELQRQWGSVGLEDFQNPGTKDLGVAMALRDCSVFLALRRRAAPNDSGVDLKDVKLADLDLKSTEGGKVEKWAAMEQELRDGGWYHSLEATQCSLSRHTP